MSPFASYFRLEILDGPFACVAGTSRKPRWHRETIGDSRSPQCIARAHVMDFTNENGEYDTTEYQKALDKCRDERNALTRKWNEIVGPYNFINDRIIIITSPVGKVEARPSARVQLWSPPASKR